MRSIIGFAAIALVAGVIAPKYAATIGAKPAPLAAAVTARPPAPGGADAATAFRTTVVPRNSEGHFEIDGRVNGHRIGFMVDTGASVIALTARDAARLGIRPPPSAFVAEVRTANGAVRAAPVSLEAVEVGDLVVRDVAALVLPEAALSDNLLGLSFLSRLRRFEYSGGRLVLEQ